MTSLHVWLSRWASRVAVLGLTQALTQAATAQCLPDAFLLVGRQPGVATTSTLKPASPKAPWTPDVLPAVDNPIRVSEAEILALPATAIVTGTDWTPKSRFEGPLLSDVLKLKPSETGTLDVLALNHYEVMIPISDIYKFAPILAYSRDGVRMKRSDFGPLFIVYPRDRYSELRAPNMAARMVWQVCRIDVE